MRVDARVTEKGQMPVIQRSIRLPSTYSSGLCSLESETSACLSEVVIRSTMNMRKERFFQAERTCAGQNSTLIKRKESV